MFLMLDIIYINLKGLKVFYYKLHINYCTILCSNLWLSFTNITFRDQLHVYNYCQYIVR